MSNPIALSPRDHALLSFLEMTPATAAQIRKASAAFPGEPFRDDRRVRERVSALHAAGLIAVQTSVTPDKSRVGLSGSRSLPPGPGLRAICGVPRV